MHDMWHNTKQHVQLYHFTVSSIDNTTITHKHCILSIAVFQLIYNGSCNNENTKRMVNHTDCETRS
jgi:hypothetical protein